MNNKSGPRTLASMAGIAAAGILMAPAAWAVFDRAAVPAGSDLKVARVVPEGDQVPGPGRQIDIGLETTAFSRMVVAASVETTRPARTENRAAARHSSRRRAARHRHLSGYSSPENLEK
jgi:hypothetical protein